MKKIFLILLLITIALAIYLNRSYAHIYNMISATNLPYPLLNQRYLINSTITTTGTIKLAFLGDSLTAGAGADNFNFSYPHLLAEKLMKNYQQIEVLNLGNPGATSADVLNNQIKLINDFEPDKIFILVGINDLHDYLGRKNLENNLRQTIIDLKISPSNIYLINIPYLGKFLPPWPTYFDWQTKRYNQVFINLKNTGVNSIDLYTQSYKNFSDDSFWYSADNFHPNDRGYQLIAGIIYYYLGYDYSTS